MAASIGDCELFGNESWGLQCCRGALSFSFLAGTLHSAKRVLENDKRSYTVWLMDIGKQAVGALLSHGMNLAASLCFTLHDKDTDECMWYFMNSLIESLVGTLLCYAIFLAIEQFAEEKWRGLCTSGYYGSPPSWRLWRLQAALWCLIVFLMKLLLFTGVVLLYKTIEMLGDVALSPLDSYPSLKLALVMVAVPITLNGAMFCITDNFLRSGYRPSEDPLLA